MDTLWNHKRNSLRLGCLGDFRDDAQHGLLLIGENGC